MSAISQNPDSALAQTWLAYRQSAATARTESGLLRSWRWRVLAVTLAGAAAGALADTLRESASDAPVWLVSGMGAASAALLLFATVLTAMLLTLARQRRWTRNRAVAEALKSECFRYAIRAAPYDSHGASELLAQRMEHLVAQLGSDRPSGVTMPRPKGLPDRLSANDYLHRRVDDQVSWYRDKADAAEQRLGRFRLASIVLGALAAMLPIVGTLLEQPGPASWAALATTAGTAVASFVYAERFAFLAETYTATAIRLETLRDRWQASPRGDADTQRLVDDVESALATENSAWMAELLREP